MKKQKISVGDWVKFTDLFDQPAIGYVFALGGDLADVLYYDADGDLGEWNLWVDNLTKTKKIRHLHYAKVGTYSAFIDTKKKILHAGCQKIPFMQVQQIAKTIRQLSKV